MYLILLGLATTAFVYLGGHIIVKRTVIDKYSDWKSLNSLVATKYTNVFKIVSVSIQLILKALWLSFIQWANNSVKKIDRYRHEVSYVINGRLYKIVVRPRRGPNIINLVVDENQNDVTSLVLPYISFQDLNYSFTPQFFDRKELYFELSNGESKNFNETDILNFN